MPELLAADLGTVVNALETGGITPDSEALAKVAKAIAQLFGVDADEVAILKVVPKYKSLKFVLPEKLSLVGTIPLTSATALRANRARTQGRAGQQFQYRAARQRIRSRPTRARSGRTDPENVSAPILEAGGSMAWFKFAEKHLLPPKPAPISRKKICAPSLRFPRFWTASSNSATSNKKCLFSRARVAPESQIVAPASRRPLFQSR